MSGCEVVSARAQGYGGDGGNCDRGDGLMRTAVLMAAGVETIATMAQQASGRRFAAQRALLKAELGDFHT